MSNDKPTIEVGDIMYNSWGWEQTNIDYYRVASRTKCFVVLEPIAGLTCDKDGNECSNNGMTGYSKPDPEMRVLKTRKTMRLKVKTLRGKNPDIYKELGGNEYVSPKYGGMFHYPGKPRYWTAYA